MRRVAVFGGTGSQGSGVVDGLLALQSDRLVKVRILTRSATVEKAVKFAARGVEVLEGSFEDETVLRHFLREVDGVFLNLDFWALGADKEISIGKKIVDISVECGVKHLIYSTLEACNRDSNGELPCPWFDGKIQIEDYVKESKIPCYTFVKMATYMENFISGHTKLTKDEEGTWLFSYPLQGGGLTLVPIHDVGRVIAYIFNDPFQFNHKSIGLAGDHLLGPEMVEIFEQTTGEKARFVEKPLSAFPPFGANMWVFKRRYEDRFKDYVRQTREIVPDVIDFRRWLQLTWPKKSS